VSTRTGRPTRRVDGEAKVLGRLAFGFDYREPDMLHGAVRRSTAAAARIRRIDVRAAAALPGVRAVVTALDVLPVNAGAIVADQPVLARDIVRYAGEPLAAIAADTPGQAARAIAAIEVELEPLAAAELTSALDPRARPVHDEPRAYAGAFQPETGGPPNLAWETVLLAGDVDRGFAAAAAVVEDEFRTPRQYQAPVEPHCAVARLENGRIVVHTPTQAPFLVRQRVAAYLGLRLGDVRIVVTPIGGGFGGKLEPMLEPLCALLARASGRPVRLAASRRDELQAGGPRENAIVRLRLGADSDGAVLALEADCLLDAGAYASETPLFASAAPLLLTGTYRIPNVHAVGRAVYTNTPPTASFRGVCGPYLCFALEILLDRLADELRLDRRELRLRNVLRAGERTAFGQKLEDACLDEAFAELDRLAPWPGERPPDAGRIRRGTGLAAQTWITNPEPGHVTLKLEEDGSVLLVSGAVEIGTGAVAIAAPLLVAEALGVRPEDVSLADADTDAAGYDGGAQGSRTTVALANAITAAAASVRAQVIAAAAELLGTDPNSLAIADGSVVDESGPRLSLAEVAATALWTRGPIVGTGTHVTAPVDFDPSTLSGAIVSSLATPTYHVHQAEVEVDTETGKVHVVRYAVAQDVGRAIDRRAIAGQVQGGVAQGIGYALFEELRLVDGIVAETSLEHYRLPTALDVPPVDLTLLESSSSDDLTNAKGVAEPPIVPVAAAIANAVADAIGRPIRQLPITPFSVLEALGKMGG
jgi:CO/xanthine dehydrogenase Mo-binding subunit